MVNSQYIIFFRAAIVESINWWYGLENKGLWPIRSYFCFNLEPFCSTVYCSFTFTDTAGFLAQHAEEKARTYSDANFSRRSHRDQQSGTSLYSSICSPRTCWVPNWGTEKLQDQWRCETHSGSYLSIHCRQRNVYKYTIKVNVKCNISTLITLFIEKCINNK